MLKNIVAKIMFFRRIRQKNLFFQRFSVKKLGARTSRTHGGTPEMLNKIFLGKSLVGKKMIVPLRLYYTCCLIHIV